MLNQEFTYVDGSFQTLVTATYCGLEATFEFHDQFNQVVLRETRQLIAPSLSPLWRLTAASKFFRLCSNMFRPIGISRIPRFV